MGEFVANDDVDIVAESAIRANHECLLSSSDERSGELERFFHDKLESSSGKDLERIVGADLSGVVALLDENGGGQNHKGYQRGKGDEGLVSGAVDRVLR